MFTVAGRPRAVFSWMLALLLPLFAVYLAVAYPIEESAYDAAAIHIPRSVVFSAARSDGGLIPRWTPELNAGLGSPVFSFYSPLPYLLMDLLNHFGIPHPIGWRVLVALALELASAGAFGLGLALFGRADVALAGAAGFTYAPYLLQEFFERGSPQGMAIALAPWILWSLLRLWERPGGLRLVLAGLAWASLILVHNLTALLFAPVVALLFVYLACRAKTARLVYPALALLAGTLVAAFHVLPFVVERQFVQLAYINEFRFELPAQNPLLLADLVALPHMYDVLRENNGLGQTMGLLQPVLLLLGLPLAAVLWQQRRDRAILLAGLTVLGLTIVWLQLPGATPIWAALPALNVLQFRWRLLSMLAFAVFAASGYLLLATPESARRWLAPLLTMAFVVMQLPFLYPQLMHRNLSFPPRPTVVDIRELARTANLPGLAGFDEFLPIWRTTPLTEQERQETVTLLTNSPAGIQVLQEQRHAWWSNISLDAPAAFTAEFRSLYYPGWQAYLDGQKQSVRPAPGSGYLSLDVPAGSHSIALRYEGTAAQHAGAWLSLSAMALLAVIGLLWHPTRAEASVVLPVYLPERWWIPALLIGLVAAKGLWLDPHTVWLRCASTAGHVCGAQVSAEAAFAGGPALRGYSVLSPSVERGGYVRLAVFWEGTAADASHLNSFVHLRNSMRDGPINPETGSDIWAQEIHESPGRTLSPGRLLMDQYRVLVPASIPPGRYYLEVGWFDPASGEQLDVDLQSLQQPLRILWRSVLLPDVEVR